MTDSHSFPEGWWILCVFANSSKILFFVCVFLWETQCCKDKIRLDMQVVLNLAQIYGFKNRFQRADYKAQSHNKLHCLRSSTVESRTIVNTWINRGYSKPKIPTKVNSHIHNTYMDKIVYLYIPNHSKQLLCSNAEHFTCNMPGGSWGKCVKVAQLCLTLCDLMDCSPPDSSVHEFSRQEYWSGFPFSSPGDHPHLGMDLGSPALQADSLPSEPPGASLYLQYAWR